MVETKKVKRVMSVGELAICLEKRWIMRDSLVQQIDRLQKIGSRITAKDRCKKKIIGARVEIERADITRRGALDGALFGWGKFCLQLVGDRLCDLALNSEYVGKIAI